MENVGKQCKCVFVAFSCIKFSLLSVLWVCCQTMFELISGYGVWHRRYFVLEGCSMSYWNHPNDKETKVWTDQLTDVQTTSPSFLHQVWFSFLFEHLRKQRAASLCPALPVSVSGLSRGTHVLDLSPSSLWATSHISSRTTARKPWPSKSEEITLNTLKNYTFWSFWSVKW